MKRFFILFLLLSAFVFGAELNGIWTGVHEGRRGNKEDVAFRFRSDGQKLSGKLLGDEFDLAIADGSVNGDQVRFTVTTTNYYSGNKVTFKYSGVLKGDTLELVRERVLTDEERAAPPSEDRPPTKQTIVLKRVK